MKCLPGILYLVATPIGNLEDITLRALRILRDEVAVVACEDTRQTSKLLQHFEIRKPLLACHEHNEKARAQEIVDILNRGESVALVSDAGTPLISDPGYRLVAAALAAGITIVPIPGASAALAALAASGLPTNEFRFIGFLRPNKPRGAKHWRRWQTESATLIAYESPHRILESLEDIETELGTRPIVLARELTKIHEEFLRGSAAEIHAVLSGRDSIKGEITLVIGQAVRQPSRKRSAGGSGSPRSARHGAHGGDQDGRETPWASEAGGLPARCGAGQQSSGHTS